MPICFLNILNYINTLEFYERPVYDMIINEFNKSAIALDHNNINKLLITFI